MSGRTGDGSAILFRQDGGTVPCPVSGMNLRAVSFRGKCGRPRQRNGSREGVGSMNTEEAKAALTGRLIEAYGFNEGLRVAGVVSDPILRDFYGVIRRTSGGSPVTEEYRTEDRRARIELTGVCRDGRAEITEVRLKR